MLRRHCRRVMRALNQWFEWRIAGLDITFVSMTKVYRLSAYGERAISQELGTASYLGLWRESGLRKAQRCSTLAVDQEFDPQ
jgi:hypothetical protein